MKNAGLLDEDQGPPVEGGNAKKRKRVVSNDNNEAGGVSGVQEKLPPVKRARKTAGGKPGITGLTASPTLAPAPMPPRDSQVLKKPRPAAGKNANYGGRAKAARISPPARDSTGSSDGDDPADTLDLDAEPSPMGDDNDDGDYAPSPTPRPKPKPKAVSKPKSTLAEKPVPAGESKTTAIKAKAKPQARTRSRLAVAQGVDGAKTVKGDAPKKAKAMMKMKPEVVSADEGKEQKGEGVSMKVELAEKSPVVVEVTYSLPEPPKLRLKPASRVTSQEVVFSIPLVSFTLPL